MKVCSRCQIEKNVSDFYKNGGRLRTICKQCSSNNAGVVEFGKVAAHRKLFENGLRKCTDCDEIKELNQFVVNRTVKSGYTHVCKKCSLERHRRYITDQKQNLKPHYLKRYAITNYGVQLTDITPELLEIAALEIRIKRTAKYYCDGKEFTTLKKFATYIRDNYNNSISCTAKRIHSGHTEEQCKVSEFNHRSQFSATAKGRVKVTFLENGETKIFTSGRRVCKELNIATEVLNRCLNTREIRRPYLNSKNKQTLKFEYYDGD